MKHNMLKHTFSLLDPKYLLPSYLYSENTAPHSPPDPDSILSLQTRPAKILDVFYKEYQLGCGMPYDISGTSATCHTPHGVTKHKN